MTSAAREEQVGLSPAGVGQERLDRRHAAGTVRALLGHRQRTEAHEVRW